MTTFLRLLRDEDKGEAMAQAIGAMQEGRAEPRVFEVDPVSFRKVPTTPFAYWVSERIRDLFQELPPFEGDGRTVKQGLATADDFRFLRVWWEVPADRIVNGRNGPDWKNGLEAFQAWCRSRTYQDKSWVPFAKGGQYSPYYADLHLVANWSGSGEEMKAFNRAVIRNPDFYFRPGLTWPRRTNGLSFRVLPAGAVFADKGPAAFVEDRASSLGVLIGLVNSAAFGYLVSVQLAREQLAQSFEVGIIQQTPVPEVVLPVLRELTLEAVALRRATASWDELDHGFILPMLLRADSTCLAERLAGATTTLNTRHERSDAIQAEIDRLAFDAYAFSEADRQAALEAAGGNSVPRAVDEADDDEGHRGPRAGPGVALDPQLAVADFLFWCVGGAFGRWDVRFATGEKQSPPSPDPFDPLPVCSPGMLQGNDGLPMREAPAGYPLELPPDGILVDDETHTWDIVRRVRAVLECVFRERGEAIEAEACEILGVASLRDWLRDPRGFFAHHLSRYSKSRRKAPIYWPISDDTGLYTLWVYYPRLTGDTLFAAINRFVEPKFAEVARQVTETKSALESASGRNAAELRTRLDDLVLQFLGLKTLKDDLLAVTALPYRPDLDDGVIICAAPLAKQFSLPRWRADCEACWHELEAGAYDWAHLAMAIWPDRVKEKAASDRSLAIAHGLASVPPPEAGSEAGAASRSAPPPRSVGHTTRPTPTAAAVDEATRAAAERLVRVLNVAEVPLGKASLMAASKIARELWRPAITLLLDEGAVIQEGAKRGTVYRLAGGGT